MRWFVWVTSNTQAGLMVTTFGVPSLVPMTGATVVVPFSPFLSTRPADWRTAAADIPEELYALWRDAVVRSHSLLTAALAEGGLKRRGGGLPSLRSILLNMIEENARHNGHADLLREALEGRVGHEPPG